MAAAWSQQIGERYRVALPLDVARWLDEERWALPGGAEFCWPLSPAQLLEPESGTIWAGFMLPDTLPLIGNAYGDWLCLRLTGQGTIGEVIYWSHAGGDWIPYGASLAEALLFDVAHFQRDIGHAGWAGRGDSDGPVGTHLLWAATCLEATGRRVPKFWEADVHRGLDDLAAAGIARCAVARDAILGHLETRLKEKSDYRLAERLQVAWEPDFVSWMFDTALIPAARRQQLSDFYEMPIDELTRQDWEAAERIALAVTRERQDLGWPYDIAGWASERRGSLEEACRRYLLGIRPSLFADNTVQFRTHWIADGFGKFAAARLFVLQDHLPAQQRDDPYLGLFLANHADTLRDRLRDYWLDQAQRAEATERPAEAYEAYYRAGWDLGLQRVDEYGPVLEGLIASAQRAGMQALASVAELHRRSL